MKRWVLAVAVLAVLFLILSVAAALYYLGPLIKKGVESTGPTITKTPVKLDSAQVSVFSGNGELRGFSIGNPDGFKSPAAIQAGSVAVALVPRTVFGDKVVVRSVKLVGPEVTFEATAAGNNLSKILANIRSGNTGQKPAGSLKKIQVDDFLLTGGKIHLTTTLLGGHSTTLTLPDIHLDNLGQGAEGITAAELYDRLFGVLLQETLKQVAQSSIGKNLSELTSQLPGVVTQKVDRVTRGLGDLLKKK